MKGKSTTSEEPVASASPSASSTIESDDETWDNKLVIDLDGSTNSDKSSPKKDPHSSNSDKKPSNDTLESEDFVKPDPPANNTNGTESNKPKGKRRQAKKNDSNQDADSAIKTTGKGAKFSTNNEKNQTPANKPGRKKAKKNTEIKQEPGSDLIDSTNVKKDPYKFDVNEDKKAISATMFENKISSTSNIQTADAGTDYDLRSIGLITEPESLGPCEPGTPVCLEGIVWQETTNGVLVVNVTWKGKSYMGTLIDSTRHDWSPPFRNGCDTPCGELEGRTPKGRGKRSRVPLSDTFKDINERKMRKELRRASAARQSPVKTELGSKRRGTRASECETEPTIKRGRRSTASSNGPISPTLHCCPEPSCGRKYKQLTGLRYHMKNMHNDSKSDEATSPTAEDTAASPASETATEPSAEKKKSRRRGRKAAAKKEEPVGSDPPTDVESVGETNDEDSNATAAASTQSSTVNSTGPPIDSANFSDNSNSSIIPVPVAAISPHLVKTEISAPIQTPTALIDKKPNVSPPVSSSVGTRVPSTTASSSSSPKILPKGVTTTSSHMAPISTITTQGIHNPALKPIQPKPTILGETTPNPALSELRDQKRLKRKRSASKEDLTNGMRGPEDKINGSLGLLQSPTYSDISDDAPLERMRASQLQSHSLPANPQPTKTFPPEPMMPRVPDLRMKMEEEIRKQFPEDPAETSTSHSTQVTNSQSNNSSIQSNRSSQDRLQLLKENTEIRRSDFLSAHMSTAARAHQPTPERHEKDRRRTPTPRNSSHSPAPPTSHGKSSVGHMATSAAHLPASTGQLPPSSSMPELPRSMMPPTGSMINHPFAPPFALTAGLSPNAAAASMLNPRALSSMFSNGIANGFPFQMLGGGIPDMKDNKMPPFSNQAGPKPGSGHKIHELESRTSPRPNSSSDRSQQHMNKPPSGGPQMQLPRNMNPVMFGSLPFGDLPAFPPSMMRK